MDERTTPPAKSASSRSKRVKWWWNSTDQFSPSKGRAMKYTWVPILLLGAGCAGGHDQDGDEKLKSGEVSYVAFTSDGKHLVAVNQLGPNRRDGYCRLRSFSTSDWKVAADTGELSLMALALAPCAGQSWMFRAEVF